MVRTYVRPALIAGLVALAGVFALWASGILAWPELIALDARYQVRGVQAIGAPIVIVPISQRMFELTSAGASAYTWPLARAIYTHALANLRMAGARAVGLDVLLESVTNDDKDLAAEVSHWHGHAILAYRPAVDVGVRYTGTMAVDVHHVTATTIQSLFLLPAGGSLTPDWPHSAGYVGVSPDADGVVHTVVPRRSVAGVSLDSLPLALVRAVDAPVAGRYAAGQPIMINYAGPPGSVAQPYDLDLVAAGLFDPRAFAGKIVLIGATDPARKDLFPGPFDHGSALTSGVEINAEAVRTLLLQRPLQRVPLPVDAGALLGLGLLVLGGNMRLRPMAAAACTLLAVLVYAGLDEALFAGGTWLALAGPLLAAGAVYVATQAARVTKSLWELRRVQAIFGRYVSPDVVGQLLGKGDALRLGGQRREISVLFSDIRGFTTLSEQLEPEEVGRMLNDYFTVMVDVIFAHGGTVDKFVGDAIMAVFNAPLDQPDHATRAVAAALAMQTSVEALVAQWVAQGRPSLRMGVGVNTGFAVVGSFGAERRSEYTAIGDTVNVASRLESLSKDLDCSIVLSATTAHLLAAVTPFEALGAVSVKGRAAPLEVYGLRRS